MLLNIHSDLWESNLAAHSIPSHNPRPTGCWTGRERRPFSPLIWYCQLRGTGQLITTSNLCWFAFKFVRQELTSPQQLTNTRKWQGILRGCTSSVSGLWSSPTTRWTSIPITPNCPFIFLSHRNYACLFSTRKLFSCLALTAIRNSASASSAFQAPSSTSNTALTPKTPSQPNPSLSVYWRCRWIHWTWIRGTL